MSLPVLLVGPVASGRAVWMHAHGEHGEHLHLAPQPALAEQGDLAGWHETQHSHHDDRDLHEGVPVGFVVEVPAIVALAMVEASASLAPAFERFARDPSAGCVLVPSRAFCEAEFYPSSWPPQERWRSGVEELLRSSHALLI